MKQVWQAYDGKLFEAAQECAEYEQHWLNSLGVRFWNEDWESMNVSHGVEMAFNDAYTLVVLTFEGLDLLKELADDMIETPNSLGLWQWSDREEKWVSRIKDDGTLLFGFFS